MNKRSDQLYPANMKPPGVLDYPCCRSNMDFAFAVAGF